MVHLTVCSFCTCTCCDGRFHEMIKKGSMLPYTTAYFSLQLVIDLMLPYLTGRSFYPYKYVRAVMENYTEWSEKGSMLPYTTAYLSFGIILSQYSLQLDPYKYVCAVMESYTEWSEKGSMLPYTSAYLSFSIILPQSSRQLCSILLHGYNILKIYLTAGQQ